MNHGELCKMASGFVGERSLADQADQGRLAIQITSSRVSVSTFDIASFSAHHSPLRLGRISLVEGGIGKTSSTTALLLPLHQHHWPGVDMPGPNGVVNRSYGQDSHEHNRRPIELGTAIQHQLKKTPKGQWILTV